MKIIFAYFTLILFSLTSVNAREKFIHKIKPDLLKVQFAGNIGVLATGIEYSFLVDKIHFGILYGFAPSSIVGRDIHTISIKNSMGLFRQPLFNKALLGITTGFSFNYSITHNTHIIMPGYYPDNYYNTNALHFAPFVSFNLNFNNENVNILKNKTIYFDIGTLDTYIWYYLKTKAMNFTEILNLAIGVNFPLFIKEKAKQ